VGAGKTCLTYALTWIALTFLSSSVVERLREFQRSTPGTALIIFYCDFNCPEKKTLRFIVGSMLRQLASQISLDLGSPARGVLQNLYGDNQNKGQPINQLMEAIKWFSKWFTTLYIIVDGVDESSRRSELCGILSLCLEMKNAIVLATSRPESEIEGSLKKIRNFQKLEVEDRFVSADIKVYIDWRLCRETKLKNIKPQLKQDIGEKLLSESRGM
jgi:hypothetical protein